MRSGGDSHTFVSVHVGADWSTYVSTYPDHPPILDVDAGSVSVSFSIAGRQVTGAALEFARELASRAAQYAAEVERLHAWQAQTGDGGGAGNGEAA